MDSRVLIAVCYKAGTMDMLRVWFTSVMSYTPRPIKIVVITAEDNAAREARDVFRDVREVSVVQVRLPPDVPTTRIHGTMLDAFMDGNKEDTEFLLTLDSDCFPVAEGWLDGLIGMMDGGAKIAGILYPWASPSKDMDHTLIAWRVRSQHCWETTHVACQMIRMADLRELNVAFAGGDDTGLLILKEAKRRGWKIDGYKVTRCAKSQDESDPEFNRYVSLIFGDKVFHYWGFTRITMMGEKPFEDKAYGWVREQIMNRRGAEFLLRDDYSYRFKFDREEEVAEDKMNRLFGLMPKKVEA